MSRNANGSKFNDWKNSLHPPGTGDVVEAVRHIRTLHKEIRMVQMMDDDELFTFAAGLQDGSWCIPSHVDIPIGSEDVPSTTGL